MLSILNNLHGMNLIANKIYLSFDISLKFSTFVSCLTKPLLYEEGIRN